MSIHLSHENNTSADGALVNTSSRITVPELLGADAAATYARDSVTAMGSSNTIRVDNSAIVKTVYYNEPTTTLVGVDDCYLYVCNDGTSNGTSDAGQSAILEIVVEYFGID